MEKVIQAAVLLPAKHTIESMMQELHQLGIIITRIHRPEDLQNTRFYDVILVHETLLERFDRSLYPNTSLIVLADVDTNITALYPKVQPYGAYTILSLPLTSSRAVTAIREAYAAFIADKQKKAQTGEKGTHIAVMSFANGTGKSMVAYNLAHKISSFFPDNAISLIDMNRPFGIAKAVLQIEERYSWDTIRPVLREGIVGHSKVANIMYATPYRFSLLAGPTEYTHAAPLSPNEYGNLLQSITQLFRISIIDHAAVENEQDLERLVQADTILCVIDARSTTILHTARGMAFLKSHAPELLNKMKFILNRVDEKKGKSTELIASRLQISPYVSIDDDPDAIQEYLETGRLFDDKTLLIDSQLYDLAERLMKDLF